MAAIEARALRVRRGGKVVLYDLGSPMPVRRVFPVAQIRIEKKSSWEHRRAAGVYTDAEMEEIGGFLRWIADK